MKNDMESPRKCAGTFSCNLVLLALCCYKLHRRSMILHSFLKDHICLCFLDYSTGVSVRAYPVLKTIFIKYNRHPVVYISYTANSFSGEHSEHRHLHATMFLITVQPSDIRYVRAFCLNSELNLFCIPMLDHTATVFII